MLEEGSCPTYKEVSELLGVSRQRGAQLSNDTVKRLRDVIRVNYPQLATHEDLQGVIGPRAGRRR